MTFLPSLVRRALLLLCAIALSGCWPGGQSQLDEEKEPHFMAGKMRVNEMDYPGAIECFEKALEVNPRSASAHFELGILYEKNQQDYAAAIYHFDHFLNLRPKSDYGDVVKQRILACKQELAKSVSLGPVTQSLQTELEKSAEENKALKQRNEGLQEQNKDLKEQLEKLRLSFARQPAAGNPSAATASRNLQSTFSSQAVPPTIGPTSTSRASGLRADSSSAALRTHTIKPGDTPAAIARKYGVRVDALMAANPKVDARRLQIGQTLAVPAPN